MKNCVIQAFNEGAGLKIKWEDGHKATWNVSLLRSYCQCKLCSATYADKSKLNDDITIESACAKDGKLVMHITNDYLDNHVTEVELDWLRRNCNCDECLSSAISRREPKYFDPKVTALPTVDYKDVVKDKDKWTYECADKVMKIGFCVVKNVPQQDSIVLKVAEMFGPVHETITNKMFQVIPQPSPRNTAHTSLGLPYHQDLPWYETEPGVQLLNAHKFDNNVIGGESQFVDLFRVADILRKEDPQAFEALTKIPASFETKDYMRPKPAQYETMKPHIEIDYFGKVVAVHWNPGVEGIVRIFNKDIDHYYKAYNKFIRILRRKELEWLFRMDAGDIVVFNNHRMAHARTEYTSKDNGKRHLQGCYINLDDFKSKYMTLGQKLKLPVNPMKVGNKSCF